MSGRDVALLRLATTVVGAAEHGRVAGADRLTIRPAHDTRVTGAELLPPERSSASPDPLPGAAE
ncbi:hypothetical protein ACFWRV_24265 [Streptomyces sp. NPDC058576]|uniref:hypothetical protein n=1 Tax=Streptomyces sp. NPDC058576 TaxID=3346547 RepID=UPI0036652A59